MQCTSRDQGLRISRRCNSMLVICPPDARPAFLSLSVLFGLNHHMQRALRVVFRRGKSLPSTSRCRALLTWRCTIDLHRDAPLARSRRRLCHGLEHNAVGHQPSQRRGARLCTTYLTSRLCAADWDISCRICPCHITCVWQAGWQAGWRAGKATLKPLLSLSSLARRLR